jgi:hypothetical protein
MADYTVSDIIDFAIDGDTIKIQHAVDDLMRERVAEILTQRKIEVGKTFFNPEESDA